MLIGLGTQKTDTLPPEIAVQQVCAFAHLERLAHLVTGKQRITGMVFRMDYKRTPADLPRHFESRADNISPFL
jgi:hypothetical protein